MVIGHLDVTELQKDSKDAEFHEESSGGTDLRKVRALFCHFTFYVWPNSYGLILLNLLSLLNKIFFETFPSL